MVRNCALSACPKPFVVMTSFGWFLLALMVHHFDTGAAFRAPNGSHVSSVKRLYDYLMKDYASFIRPVSNSSEGVRVYFQLFHYKVEDLDEKNQAFKLFFNMHQSWTDVGLVWDPKEFDGLTYINMPYDDIWHPDVSLRNSKNPYFLPPAHHNALVTQPGKVFYNTYVNIETQCDLDLSQFPFDEHTCEVVFEVWNEHALSVNLVSPDATVRPDVLLTRLINENLEWEVINVTARRNVVTYSYTEEPYVDITYGFTIRRRSTFVTHLFVGPSVVLCSVTPVVFLLPSSCGQKIMFGVGVLIADTLLLGELIDYIPTAHPNLPLLAKYFVANIALVSLSLAISAIIIGFWDKSTSRLIGPHAFFRLIFLGPLATILCVRKDDLFPADASSGNTLEINPEGEGDTESTTGVDPETDRKRRFMTSYLRNAARSEWRQLAVVFDRLFFVIYCVIVSILTLSFARYI